MNPGCEAVYPPLTGIPWWREILGPPICNLKEDTRALWKSCHLARRRCWINVWTGRLSTIKSIWFQARTNGLNNEHVSLILDCIGRLLSQDDSISLLCCSHHTQSKPSLADYTMNTTVWFLTKFIGRLVSQDDSGDTHLMLWSYPIKTSSGIFLPVHLGVGCSVGTYKSSFSAGNDGYSNI